MADPNVDAQALAQEQIGAQEQAGAQQAGANEMASGIPEPPENMKRASIAAITLISNTHEDIVNTMGIAMEKSDDPVVAVAGASIKVMMALQEGIKGVSPDVVFSLSMLIVPILLALGEKAKLWSGVGLEEVNAVLQKLSQLVAEQQGQQPVGQQPVDAQPQAGQPGQSQAVPSPDSAAQQPAGLLSRAM